VKVSATIGAFGHYNDFEEKNRLKRNGYYHEDEPQKLYTSNYFGLGADFFGNNSLGLGLQQTYTVNYQRYLKKCDDYKDVEDAKEAQRNESIATNKPAPLRTKDSRFFASVGIGAGYMNQRLYLTQGKLSAAVLPLSAQFSYLQGKTSGIPPKLRWYAQLGYMPVLTDLHAYQLGAIAGLLIPTPLRWLTVNLTETDLYMNNAPAGFKRNYQNGSISFIFTAPRPPPKVPTPYVPQNAKGACYGGDKLARLYCYDDVTSDVCTPPSLFRASQHCASAGTGALPEGLETATH
jgi:hypothetical protein